MLQVAKLYEAGEGVGQDPGMAIHWYEAAAKAGSGPAKTRLKALADMAPQGVEAAWLAYRLGDFEGAVKLVKPLADKGDIAAEGLMGKLYFQNLTSAPAYEICLRLFAGSERCRGRDIDLFSCASLP